MGTRVNYYWRPGSVSSPERGTWLGATEGVNSQKNVVLWGGGSSDVLARQRRQVRLADGLQVHAFKLGCAEYCLPTRRSASHCISAHTHTDTLMCVCVRALT